MKTVAALSSLPFLPASIPSPGPRRLRGTAAAVAGAVAVITLSLGTDAALRAAGIFPGFPQRMAGELYVMAATYRTLYGALGSYLAARLAPGRPMAYALGLGGFGFVTSLIGALATWNNGPEFGPHWYPLTLVVTALPAAWLGGRLSRAAARAGQ